MRHAPCLDWLPALLLAACTSPGAPGGPDGTSVGGDPDAPGGDGHGPDAAVTAIGDAMVNDPAGCSPVFAGSLLADYQVTISDAEWAELWDEFIHVIERDEMDLDLTPWHPIMFRWQDSAWIPAMIRLKGQSSWVMAVQYDDPPKAQFVISFNEVDREARFAGLRKIELDMPRNDRSFLRQRLATAVLRALGIYAQCASSARLYINGAYYGLYTALERKDKEFVQRCWPGSDEGVLWEAGRSPKVNEDAATDERIDAFWAVTSADELASLADMDYSIREWASEALINNGDGYYGGRHNFYLYDHPARGFLWIPHDLDATWDQQDVDRSPIFPTRDWPMRMHYPLVLGDPYWLDRYLGELRALNDQQPVAALLELVDAWAAQIADAAQTDPNRPFTAAEHREAVVDLRRSIEERRDYLHDWFDCRDGGGPDADGDGFDFCFDCDDDDGTAHPDAIERCNGLDDDCDGWLDEAACPP